MADAELDQSYVAPAVRRAACELVELAESSSRGSVRSRTRSTLTLRDMRTQIENIGTGHRYTPAERRLAARMLAHALRNEAATDGA